MGPYVVIYGVTPGKNELMLAEFLMEGDDSITVSYDYEAIKAQAKEADDSEFIVIDAASLVECAARIDRQLCEAAFRRIQELEAALAARDSAFPRYWKCRFRATRSRQYPEDGPLPKPRRFVPTAIR